MKSTIVTGASGFLGSHLSEALINQGFQVIGLDNFLTGLRTNKEYLEKKFGPDKFLFFEQDVVQSWTSIQSQIPPERLKNLKYIFHFASPASPPHYQRLSVETIWVNTLGLENAIRFADEYGARVVFASTSEIYGDPTINPQPESYWGNVNSYGPRSCYDEAKRCGESVIYSYNERNKAKYGGRGNHGLVRIFNTYGPRMNPNDGRVVINFLVQALRGEALTVYGSGKQTRSFCYVSDLIHAILKYAESHVVEPVNIGNPTEFTILELAQIVQEIFKDKKLSIEYKELPGDDPRQRRPDITKALRLLSPWEPQVQLEEGLRKMLEWLKSSPQI